MKIWVQSGGPIGMDTGYSGYEQSLKRHVKAVARPDSTVDVFGVEGKPPKRDQYFSSQHIVKSWVTRNAVKAEAQGYDVFAVVCTLDHGYYEVREMVDIPVVFIMESAMHLACQLAPKFAFLTHNQALLLRLEELARRYGLSGCMTPGGYLKFSSEQFGDVFSHPEPFVKAIVEEGKKVIAQGANILLLSGNPINMLMVDKGIRDIDGAPILDVCGTVIKMAELMVDLNKMGITRSRSGLFGSPSQSERAQLSKFLGAE